MRNIFPVLLIFTAVYLLSCGHKTGAPEDIATESDLLSAWTVLGPSNSVIARAIVDDDECPEITVTLGNEPIIRQMDLRASSDLSKDFPVTVCESFIPEDASGARIGERVLPLSVSLPDRIVIIGDTGCRLKAKDNVYQACNDPDAWPFKKIAESIAAWDPELIILAGDYFYRENECPPGNAGCEGSPYGDTWDAWKADFFIPGEALLNAAPLVMIRGNHERCERGGTGWFLMLDTTIESPLENDNCYNFSKPFLVNIGHIDLLHMDSSEAIDAEAPKELVDEYASQFEQLSQIDSEGAWLLVHHPLWGIRYGDEPDTNVKCCSNLTLQTAREMSFPESVDLIVSGHIHMFQYLNFNNESAEESPLPSQLITGGGGVKLYTSPSGSITGRSVAGMTIEEGEAIPEFSFMTVEFKDDGVVEFTVRDVGGSEIRRCELRGEDLDCGV